MKKLTKLNENPNPRKQDKIVIGDDLVKGKNNDDSTLICSYCSCNTIVRLRDFGDNNTTLWCKKCNISLDDNNIRKESKLGTQLKDIEPAVVSVGYDAEGEITLHKPVPIRGGMAELQKKGIRVTSYHTTEKT